MHITYIVPHLRTACGWRSAAIGTINAIQKTCGVSPVIVVSRADEEEARKIFSGAGIIPVPETQHMAFSVPATWQKIIACRTAVLMKHFPETDLVHSLDAYPTGLVGHWISGRVRVPHVLTALGTYAITWHNNFLDNKIYAHVLKTAARICPMSNGTEAMMRKYYSAIMPEDKVRVVRLGTDYCRKIPRSISESRNSSGHPVIMSVGEVKYRKGYHVTVKAFAQVKKRFPDAEYWIIGDLENVSYVESLKKIISELSISGVRLYGGVSGEKLHECYSRAWLFCLASQEIQDNFEGFGLVFLEAGAFGLPVIGTKSGGIPDAVRENETGFLFEQDDIHSIANAMIRLIENPDLRRSMGMANRNWAETLTWERFAKEQYKIYETLVKALPLV